MKEQAEAVKEVAKTAGKAVDAASAVGKFISKYVGGPIEQAVGIFEDKLKYLRWERQVRLMDRANHYLQKRGFDGPTRQVPLTLLVPFMQGGSLEENDALQDKWAALLANAADVNCLIEIRRAYASVLEDLTAFDASILEKIYSFDVEHPPDKCFKREVWTTFLPDRVADAGEVLQDAKPEDEKIRPSPEVEISLGNLTRLGLVTPAVAWGGIAIFSCVHRTVFGREFMKACSTDYT